MDLEATLRAGTPLIDVRAPAEFAKGALPASRNLPIMDDEERRQVGIAYKREGQACAMQLGLRLVSGAHREARIQAWLDFIAANPTALLYCARGGLRSEIACDWLAAAGKRPPRIPGGYKAIRNHLLRTLEKPPSLTLVSGQTGCGKTRFIQGFHRHLDLEALANHRGSAFGGYLSPQPPQASFENALALDYLELGTASPVLAEDEGKLIGRVLLPQSLQRAMAQAPILLIEMPMEERATNILDEYIVRQWADYRAALGEAALPAFARYLLAATDAIKKRLGGAAHARVRAKVDAALARQAKDGALETHRPWIEDLLRNYYDPMYNYQLSRKRERVAFAGAWEEAREWCSEGFACS